MLNEGVEDSLVPAPPRAREMASSALFWADVDSDRDETAGVNVDVLVEVDGLDDEVRVRRDWELGVVRRHEAQTKELKAFIVTDTGSLVYCTTLCFCFCFLFFFLLLPRSINWLQKVPSRRRSAESRMNLRQLPKLRRVGLRLPTAQLLSDPRTRRRSTISCGAGLNGTELIWTL